MQSKNHTSSSTVTQQEPKSNILYLRLLPKFEIFGRKIEHASSEETKNHIEAAQTREELDARVEEVLENLKKAIHNSLEEAREAVKKMIPQEPEDDSEEA